MTLYREDSHSQLLAMAQHVGLAEAMLALNVELHQQLAIMPKLDPRVDKAVIDTWRDLWAALDHARAILVEVGRDTTAFDTARERAGNPLLVVGRFTPLREPMRVATREAIVALRVAAPEVDIPKVVVRSPVTVSADSFALSSRWQWSAQVQMRAVVTVLAVVACTLGADLILRSRRRGNPDEFRSVSAA